MIYIGNKDISLIYYANKSISEIYYGSKLVWQAIKSCFASGFWVNEKPWINTEGWKNNN